MKKHIMIIFVLILSLLLSGLSVSANPSDSLTFQGKEGVSYDENVDNFKKVKVTLNDAVVEGNFLKQGSGEISTFGKKEPQRYDFTFEELELDEQGFYVGEVELTLKENDDVINQYNGKINIKSDMSLISGSIRDNGETLLLYTVGEKAANEAQIRKENAERLIIAREEARAFQEASKKSKEPSKKTIGTYVSDEGGTYDPNLRLSHYSNNVYMHLVGSYYKTPGGGNSRYGMRVGISEYMANRYYVLDNYFYIYPHQYSSGAGISVDQIYPRSTSAWQWTVGYSYYGVSVGLSVSNVYYSVNQNSATSWTKSDPSSSMNMAWEGRIGNSNNRGGGADFYMRLMDQSASGSCYGYQGRGAVDVRSYSSGSMYTWKQAWISSCLKGS